MGESQMRFDTGIIAAVAVVLGITYFLGAMLSLLSESGNTVLLLSGSIPVTTVIGVLLTMTGGLLATGQGNGRYVGALAFGAVVVFGRPSLVAPEGLRVVQAGVALLITVYLTFRNPVPKPDRSNVDESTSATKVGSTIR